MSTGNSRFDGWDHYPRNLDMSSHKFNLEYCHQRLQRDSKTLFSQLVTDIHIETVDRSGDGQYNRTVDRLSSEDEIETALTVGLHEQHEYTALILKSGIWTVLVITTCMILLLPNSLSFNLSATAFSAKRILGRLLTLPRLDFER
jgi:hypothetical protein